MFPQLDITAVTTQTIADRTSKVGLGDLARPFDPLAADFAAFVDSLPRILKADDLREIAATVARARRTGSPVVLMIGAHVIKTGLAPVLIDLMERGHVQALAMNSAAAIHDSESALFGVTSEDVATNLRDGSFGMWRETGEFINGVLGAAWRGEAVGASGAGGEAAATGAGAVAAEPIGYGEALGRALIAAEAPHLGVSLLAAGVRLGVPVTVHAAIGTDIVHQQPTMDGAATGGMSFRDFKVLAHVVRSLDAGSAVLNIGSAVILPEIFLKVLTVVRNLGFEAAGFLSANFDMLQHYRPNMNVVSRPTQGGGRGYTVTGHHEIMVPLLAAMIKLYDSRLENQ